MIVELDINGKKIWVKEDETLNAHYELFKKGSGEPDTFHKHVFISHGEELELSGLQRIRAFYEIVTTDTPIEALKDGAWKKKIKLL